MKIYGFIDIFYEAISGFLISSKIQTKRLLIMGVIIHPTACVDPKAQLGVDVEIGPFAIIEANCILGDRTKVYPHAHLMGNTEMGEDNVIFSGAAIGFPAQVVGLNLPHAKLKIGSRNTFREYVTVHTAMSEEGCTVIGNECYFMGLSHIAHDCKLENNVILANGALLAGHVTVGSRAFLSGNACVHQYCRVGQLAMIAGGARIPQDIPPYTMIEGSPGRIRGINRVGLRRAGISIQEQTELKQLLRSIYWSDVSKTVTEKLAELESKPLGKCARQFLDFYKGSSRGITPFVVRNTKNQDTPDEA